MQRPIIGVTLDNKENTASSGVYEVGAGYSRAVSQAGGLAVMLPHEIECAAGYVQLCDGIILTGGVDPRTETFGQPTHEKARPVDAKRQAFELALLTALDQQRDKPVLGVCLGMQMMALHHGGALNQYLPETHKSADLHSEHKTHALHVLVAHSALGQANDDEIETVVSHHQQAVTDPGRMRLIAESPDGVIESIDDPKRRFYLGVQWHPERGGAGAFNDELIRRFVAACSPRQK